MFKMTRYKC